jgi:ABC-type multidrug transport system permease subunit
MKKIRDRRSFFCNLTLLSLSITNSSYARNYKLEITQFSSLMTATFDKLYAILRRDLLTTIRHRSGFVLSLVGTFTELAAFYFLSRAIGSGFRPDGVGTGVYTFFVMSVQAFVSAVQEAQQTGTLEVLMTSSTGPVELLILSSISAFAGTLGNLLIYLSAGVAVFRAAIHPNFFSCVAVMI